MHRTETALIPCHAYYPYNDLRLMTKSPTTNFNEM